MPKKGIEWLVRGVMFILAGPILAVGLLCNFSRLALIIRDFRFCRDAVRNSLTCIPDFYIYVLVVSEDRRNRWHCGVDVVSIVRAIVMFVLRGSKGGASTIEQQLVRTLTGRYEKTLQRKFREQLIAVALAVTMPRRVLASKYLEIAYFGSGKTGVMCFEKAFQCSLGDLSVQQVIGVLARLKYPEPIHPTAQWRDRFARRCRYIERRLNRAIVANFSGSGLQKSLSSASVSAIG